MASASGRPLSPLAAGCGAGPAVGGSPTCQRGGRAAGPPRFFAMGGRQHVAHTQRQRPVGKEFDMTRIRGVVLVAALSAAVVIGVSVLPSAAQEEPIVSEPL